MKTGGNNELGLGDSVLLDTASFQEKQGSSFTQITVNDRGEFDMYN